MNNAITHERIHQIFSYEHLSGRLIWKSRQKSEFAREKDWKIFERKCAGKPAGWLQKNGYRYVKVDGVNYQAHRLIWFYVHAMWPDRIDHENHNHDDNRIGNLRDVSHSGNMKNMSISKRNKSGRIGVSWDARRKKWTAQIGKEATNVMLGRFDTEDEAKAARKAGEKLLGFHRNHGRKRA